MPFGIQPWHLIVVAIVALVIFGPARLPQLGRSIGSFFRDLRAGARDMSSGFKEGIQESEASKVDAAKSGADGAAGGDIPSASAPTKPEQSASNGKPASGNFCIHCGSPNPSHALFCNACGKKIKD
jgi:sec-independent protein translocase protein TatA